MNIDISDDTLVQVTLLGDAKPLVVGRLEDVETFRECDPGEAALLRSELKRMAECKLTNADGSVWVVEVV